MTDLILTNIAQALGAGLCLALAVYMIRETLK